MAEKQVAGSPGDPFGTMLMQAYMGGMMPGGQGTSNWNTVLDLLSPGAVAMRQEQSQPNLQEMYANMFGVTPQMGELEKSLAIKLGIAPGPEQQAQVDAAIAEAQGKMGVAQVEATQEESEFARTFGLEEEKFAAGAGERKLTEAEGQLKNIEAMERVNQLMRPDPAFMQQMFDLSIDSMALTGDPIDPNTGQPIEYDVTGENEDFIIQQRMKNQEMAQKFLQIRQGTPGVYQAVAAMLNNDQPQGAFALLNDLYPGMFSLTDPWFLSPKLTPNVSGMEAPGGMTPDMFLGVLNQSMEANRKILQDRREGKK